MTKGLVELSPIPQPEELVAQMLRYLLDPSDKDRAFVPFDSSDETCLLINNFGGMSNLETEALTTVTMKILGTHNTPVVVRVPSTNADFVQSETGVSSRSGALCNALKPRSMLLAGPSH